MTITYKDNEEQNLKVSYLNVRLHSKDAKTLEDKPLTMVIVKGFHADPKTLDYAYMVLFTVMGVRFNPTQNTVFGV